MKPTLIVKKQRMKYRTKRGVLRSKVGLLCDNGVCYRGYKELSDQLERISWATIASRISRYELSSPAVLYDGMLTQDVLDEFDIDSMFKASGNLSRDGDRVEMSRCKRDGNNCDLWSDRLGQRLGIEGCGCDCNPDDTDCCYRYTLPHVNYYGSGLAGAIYE